MKESTWSWFLHPPRQGWLVLASLAACAVEGGHPPVARIEADPSTISEHDGFQTAVTLDATTSADPLDDPEGTRPLRYRWQILGDEYRYDSGNERSATPAVRFRGDRPATIALTVTDEDGDSSTTHIQMQLTVTR